MRVIMVSLCFEQIQWGCAECGSELNQSDTYPQTLTHPTYDETGFIKKTKHAVTCKFAGRKVNTPSWEAL